MCALDPIAFIIVSYSTKEKWNLLETTYKSSNQVKVTKINMLVHSYEMVKMKQNESIKDMLNRFQGIINALIGLGKIYLNGEMVGKMLKSFPRSQKYKLIVI